MQMSAPGTKNIRRHLLGPFSKLVPRHPFVGANAAHCGPTNHKELVLSTLGGILSNCLTPSTGFSQHARVSTNSSN